MNNLLQYFNKQVLAAPLIVFKTIFGALMIVSTIRFMWLGWIEDHYINPTFQFKYWGFEWIEPLSIQYLYAIHFLIILAAFGIILCRGTLYRIATIVVFLSFTYTELIDLTYYLNHYYFVSCICFLLIFIPSTPSIFRIKNKNFYVPNWSLLILKIQISFVYLYAGIAKINYDWLINALPLKIWLNAQDKIPLIGKIFEWQSTPYVFSWAGMIYDCTIIFFLIYKKTRIYAFATVIVFHTLTGILFQIGVFPIVMIGCTLIFFDWNFSKNPSQHHTLTSFQSSSSDLYANYITLRTVLLCLYFLFQTFFPFRFLFYSNNLSWSEEGYRFSWRVMLLEKAGTATFYVRNPITGKEGIVNNSEFLNLHQEKQMAMQPDMILQYAHFLGEYYQKLYHKSLTSAHVRAEVYVTLNGRASKLLVNPNINLMNEEDTFLPKKWVTNYYQQ